MSNSNNIGVSIITDSNQTIVSSFPPVIHQESIQENIKEAVFRSMNFFYSNIKGIYNVIYMNKI